MAALGALALGLGLAARFGVSRVELWNYLPMEDHADERDLIAPLSELVPALLPALDEARARKVEAVVKYVPRCALGEHADRDGVDEDRAEVLALEADPAAQALQRRRVVVVVAARGRFTRRTTCLDALITRPNRRRARSGGGTAIWPVVSAERRAN